MFGVTYDFPTILSAVISLVIVVFALRAGLYYANRKRKGSRIVRPDWVDGSRFEVSKKARKEAEGRKI